MSFLPQGFEYFADAGKFMVLPDGRIAYHTERRSWVEVFLHGLPLDDYLYSQSIKPNPFQFEWKVYKKRKSKKKESLNDGGKCDLCKEEMKTVIFRKTRNHGKVAICQQCYDNIDYIDSLQLCWECHTYKECELVKQIWDLGVQVVMCHECIHYESCPGCGLLSGGGDLCFYCRCELW